MKILHFATIGISFVIQSMSAYALDFNLDRNSYFDDSEDMMMTNYLRSMDQFRKRSGNSVELFGHLYE